MRILVVDDSRLAATSLVRVLAKVKPKAACEMVLSATEALALCEGQRFDVAFLDIEMPGINGFEVARKIKLRTPQTNIVFVTGYPEYALDAWSTQASAFLVKPADENDVRRALDSLRNPVSIGRDVGLYIQCFGNLEVFFDGVPVTFERQHTKELLGYLIDRRGAFVSNGELMAVLWEGLPDTRSRRSQLRTLISDLRHTLERLGHPDAVVKQRGGVAIRIPTTECDYYGFIRGLPEAINRYRGEYMCQYSWAEPTAALLLADYEG